MNLIEWAKLADYGVSIIISIGFIYIMGLLIHNYTPKKKNDYLIQIVKNNTEAMNNLTEMTRTMQLTLVELNTKNDEILAKLRRLKDD